MINVTCCKCSIVFGMSDDIYHRRQKDGENFTCTNGHVMIFTPSENSNLKKEVKRLKELLSDESGYVRYWKNGARQLQRSLSATRGVVTKLKKKLYPERYEE